MRSGPSHASAWDQSSAMVAGIAGRASVMFCSVYWAQNISVIVRWHGVLRTAGCLSETWHGLMYRAHA
eukprot:15335025-Ditylum_brightwellii.AAC.1